MNIENNERVDSLSKNYKIIQLKDYYSMSTDSYLLAHFSNVPKKSSKKILDLCSGNGAISLLLREKTNANITMLDIQHKLIELAKKSVSYNNLDNFSFVTCDLKNVKEVFNPATFDYIVCNPPYFKVEDMPKTKIKNNHSISRHEILCTLEDVFCAMKYLLKQNGKFSLVHRPNRLLDIFTLAKFNNLAIKKIRFVYSKKTSKDSIIVLVEGGVSAVSDTKIEQPLYIYEEDNTYTKDMREVYGF